MGESMSTWPDKKKTNKYEQVANGVQMNAGQRVNCEMEKQRWIADGWRLI